MRLTCLPLSLVLLVATFCASSAFAQTNPNLAIGLTPYQSYDSGNIDSVSLLNGNLNVNIPLYSYPQRGASAATNYVITYNDKNWYVSELCLNGPNNPCQLQWRYAPSGGGGIYIASTPFASYSWAPLIPHQASATIFTAHTADGAAHFMMPDNAGGYRAADGSGIWSNGATTTLPAVTKTSDGTTYSSNTNGTTIEDANGNYVTLSGSTQTMVTDNLDRSFPADLGGGTSTTDFSGCVAPASPTQISSAVVVTLPGPNNANSSVKICGATYQISFSTGNLMTVDANGFSDTISNGSATLGGVVSIVLYNGTSWSTSPAWGFDYLTNGSLGKITFPTGGTITYSWGGVQVCPGYAGLTPLGMGVISRAIDAHDGTGSHTTSYFLGASLPGNQLATIVTDANSNDTVHAFSDLVYQTCSLWETQTKYYQGSYTSGTLLKTVNTDYTFTPNPYASNMTPPSAINVFPIRKTTIWPNGQTTKVETDYDPNFRSGSYNLHYGKVLAIREYDYANNAPGPLLRTTTNTYLPFTNGAYLSANLLNLLSSSTITNGSGTQVAQTTYSYDVTTLQPGGITTQRDLAYNTTSPGTRGDPTSSCKWLNTTGANICSSIIYYDTGMPYQATDPIGNVTTYNFSSTYAGAYLTQTTQPQTGSFQHITSATYDFNTGLLTSSTDQNNQTTTYAYDSLWRISQANFPDRGQSTYAHQESSFPFTASVTTKMNSSQNFVSTNVFDGLGRVSQTQLNSDPDGVTYTATTYDPLGRVFQQYNPTRCNPPTTNCSSESTWGVTTNYYDALGRQCLVVPADGTLPAGGACPSSRPTNDILTVYSGNTTTVTDQAGNSRKSGADGLGRLTQVFEDPSGNNFETDYQYDALDNLVCVAQKGTNTGTFSNCASTPAAWRPRTFTYDSLSRLTQAVNPESGTISYAYDPNGNLLTKTSPAPNQTGTATVTTCFGNWNGTSCDGTGHDALNRVTKKTYSDGTTPTVINTYDVSSVDSFSGITNPVGRLVKTAIISTYSANSYFEYDAMGRISVQGQCVNNNCLQWGSIPAWWLVSNSYDLAGDLTSYTDAAGTTFTQTFDAAGRPTQLSSSWVDSAHPANLYTVDATAGYTPINAVQNGKFGNSLYETARYDNRLQPCHTVLNTSGTIPSDCTTQNSGNLLDYAYGYNSGTANNGNVMSWTAVGQQTFNRSFTYDPLNRIYTMNQLSGTAQGCSSAFILSWTIDPWGNRTDQNPTAGTCNPFHQGVNAKNQFVSGSYDAAGNLLYDGVHTYTYDAENRITQVDQGSTATYLYDAIGQRVGRSVPGAPTPTTYYVYGSDGHVVSERTVSGSNYNWSQTYARLGGKLIALYNGNTTVFYHPDHLGSTRLVTLFLSGPPYNPPSGCVQPNPSAPSCIVDNMDYLPFSERLDLNSSVTPYQFTGKERDSESNLDNFGARYNSSSLGRFMSPDWAKGISPVAYADISDPQTMNRYAYVGNNPLGRRDLDGHHEVCDPDTSFTDEEGALHVVAGKCHEVPDWWQFQGVRNWFRNTGASLGAVFSKSLGSWGGPRAGRPFTRTGRQLVINDNAAANGGQTTCVSCGRPTVPAQQSQAGVTPPDNETAVDHIWPQSQLGDGVPNNGQLLCRACNGLKSDSLPNMSPWDQGWGGDDRNAEFIIRGLYGNPRRDE